MSFMEQYCSLDPETATEEEAGEIITEGINFYRAQLCNLDYPPEDMSFVLSAVNLLYHQLLSQADEGDKNLSKYYNSNIGFIVPPPSEIAEDSN